MKIAFLSDLHLDFWISAKLTDHKEIAAFESFIFNDIELEPADILILSGDISHYNKQIKLLLELIIKTNMYKKIFIVHGNHEMYLISNAQESKYNKSINKIIELKQICEKLDTVEFLDGNIIEFEGISIGGTSMWYDFSYGKKLGNMDDFHMLQKWKQVMNDANLIKGTDSGLGLNDTRSMYAYGKMKVYSFNPLNFFEQEKEKMLKILNKCDIFISHIGPVVPPNIEPKYKNIDTGFYYFDGEHYLWGENTPKLWFFGHTHTNHNFTINNTKLLCNPLGYKSEYTLNKIEIIEFNP